MNFITNKPLHSYYKELEEDVNKSGKIYPEAFNEFDKYSLTNPATWFKALSVFEMSIDTCPTKKETEDFFLLLFKGYDTYASIDLNDEDYNWFWDKIHHLLDKFSVYFPSALTEKGFQFFFARRGYVDKEKTLYFIQKAADEGDEAAHIMLGYYLYFGFCGITDKERGMELMNSAETEIGKIRADIYKGYINLSEGKTEETKQLLDEIEKNNTHPELLRLIYEQKAYILEITENYEEAAVYYQRTIDELPSAGYSMMRLAFIHYNQRLESSKTGPEAIAMMEEAFKFGRTDVIRSLYFCYFSSGMEWEDKERGIYWLNKGFLYNDDYSTAELAYLYLYNEEYKDIEKGLYYLDLAIEMKYAEALVNKAYLCFEGIILEKDIKKSLGLLDKAIELGSGNAAFRAGIIYEEGTFHEEGTPNYSKALEYYEKAAELNDASGCGYAGRYYLIGLGVDEDKEKAKAYYEKGVSLGNPYSIVELAIMYEEGSGVEQDLVKAFELYKLGSDYNYAYAWYMLGRCYKYEQGTDENPDEAIVCFEKAAEQDHAKAQAELGYCYETGYGLEADPKKAMEYMLQSAENGYPYAQYKVGCYYLYGLDGIQTDYEKAVEWFTKAVDNDYPYAMLEMGDYYLYNYGGTDERAKAYEYYVKAAENDVVNEGLGLCLEYGYGVESNEGEAFKYYLKAAEDDYVRGKYNVALCYYFGYGVKENRNEAYRWFNDASNEEHTGAIYYKAKMLLAGEGTSQNIEEGIILLKNAAEADESAAQFELGNCYLVGKGVEENEDLAMEWFEKAADNGHEQALKITGRRSRK